MGGEYSTHGRKGNSYVVLDGKPEVKRQHLGPICRWENIIKIDCDENVMGISR
jgi:hypothetical protein